MATRASPLLTLRTAARRRTALFAVRPLSTAAVEIASRPMEVAPRQVHLHDLVGDESQPGILGGFGVKVRSRDTSAIAHCRRSVRPTECFFKADRTLSNSIVAGCGTA